MRSPGRVVLLAALLMVGCAQVAPTVKIARPPAELMQDCPAPPADATTNAGLARWIVSLKEALRLCNADKAALREWLEKTQ